MCSTLRQSLKISFECLQNSFYNAIVILILFYTSLKFSDGHIQENTFLEDNVENFSQSDEKAAFYFLLNEHYLQSTQ